jgi:predicted HicB family RNase H-like nuclease
MDIPVPLNDDEKYSGKFVLRVPKTLHKILVENARKEGISLNQYALFKLSH